MNAQPRYRQLAEALRADIASGRYPVGAQLPPELELCQHYGVSRHTARDALRLLTEGGLVERRRGAGTTVTATAPAPAFVQPLDGVDELLQYARDARLEVRSAEQRKLTQPEAARLRTRSSGRWLVVEGLRVADGEPVALSDIYLAPTFGGLADEIRSWPGAIQELLVQRHGLSIERIEQEICADVLDRRSAGSLRAEEGSPALRTLRRYYDAGGKLVLASDSRHPAARFVYAMTYRREA